MAKEAGMIRLLPMGGYNPETPYEVLHWVRYNGVAWVCKQANTGNTPVEGDFWTELCEDGTDGVNGTDGEDGTNAYVHIRYSVAADGTGFVATPTAATKYIGIYAGTSSTAPADKTAYAWSKYVGDSGTGSGDMTKAVYDQNDDGKVDHAEDADRLGGQLPEYYQQEIKNLGALTTIDDADTLPFTDVSGSVNKKITFANIVTAIKTVIGEATTALAGLMSPADKTKLNGIAPEANNYSLPTASSSTKGGVKVGAGLEVADDVLSVSINEVVLTKTLTAGETSITFTDPAIVTGNTVKIGIETEVLGLNYTDGTISAGSLTLTYPAQATDTTVWVTIKEVA